MPTAITAPRDGQGRRRRVRLSLVDEAVASIREMILSGALQPGARINLDETAAELEMSPIPLREAMRVLNSQGLVDSLPQKGYRVRPATYEDLLETYRLRRLLDPLAVKLAVPKLAKVGMKRVDQAFVELSEAIASSADWDTRRTIHREFHFSIYEASGSGWLLTFLEMLWGNSERYQRLRTASRSQRQDLEEHRRILEACRSGNARHAAATMEDHIANTERTVAPLLKRQLTDSVDQVQLIELR